MRKSKVIEALAYPVRATFIPGIVRGAYAVVLKRAWEWLWPEPVLRLVPFVGWMKLRPNSIVSCRLGIFGV